ncbi:hypothetical protein HK405_011885 [Cladochytrium tenue]|nr:hypothetical protein HK405_011885 [Cladochytrium tenue]
MSLYAIFEEADATAATSAISPPAATAPATSAVSAATQPSSSTAPSPAAAAGNSTSTGGATSGAAPAIASAAGWGAAARRLAPVVRKKPPASSSAAAAAGTLSSAATPKTLRPPGPSPATASTVSAASPSLPALPPLPSPSSLPALATASAAAPPLAAAGPDDYHPDRPNDYDALKDELRRRRQDRRDAAAASAAGRFGVDDDDDLPHRNGGRTVSLVDGADSSPAPRPLSAAAAPSVGPPAPAAVHPDRLRMIAEAERTAGVTSAVTAGGLVGELGGGDADVDIDDDDDDEYDDDLDGVPLVRPSSPAADAAGLAAHLDSEMAEPPPSSGGNNEDDYDDDDDVDGVPLVRDPAVAVAPTPTMLPSAAALATTAVAAPVAAANSRVVLLTNLVGPGQVDNDLQDETAAECSRHGKVVRCVVFEAPQGRLPDHLAVRVFVEFARPEDAALAQSRMDGRFFGGRTVAASFYDEERFTRLDLL